jgi:hypothetical protein
VSVARPRPRRTPLQGLVRMLVRAPFLALPFAIFFWVQKPTSPRLFAFYFLAALIFTMSIGLAIWATE